MRMLTETEMGVVAGGGPPPPPWEDPLGDRTSDMPFPSPHRRPWEAIGLGDEDGDDGGNGKGSGETPEEARRGETDHKDEQIRNHARTAKETCRDDGVKKVDVNGFECYPPR